MSILKYNFYMTFSYKVCIIGLDHIFSEKSSSTFWQVRCCAHRTWRSCPKYDGIFFKFCGLLRKPKLYLITQYMSYSYIIFTFKIPPCRKMVVYVTKFVIFGNNLPFYETRNIFRLEGFQNNFCRTISPSPRFYFEGGNDLWKTHKLWVNQIIFVK